MGLINLNVYTTKYGYDVTNTYISVGDNDISLKKENGSWILETELNIWHSKNFLTPSPSLRDIYGVRMGRGGGVFLNCFKIIFNF